VLKTITVAHDVRVCCTADSLQKVWDSEHSVSISVNGCAASVIRDADTFRALLALVERLEAIDKIRAGLDSARNGTALPVDEVFDSLRRKHGLSD
jgi:hypothetical protein